MFDNVQRGQYLIGDKEYYFRSKWEANYALYLEFLKKNGEIADWKYECKWFEFPEVKHGATRYLPDFQVTENNGVVKYKEVKGFLTSRAKAQLRHMKKYYPEIDLELVDSEQMKALNKYKKLLKFY